MRRPLHVGMVHLSDFRLDSRIQRQATALAERGDVVDVVGLGQRDELHVGEGVIRVHSLAVRKPAGGARAYLEGYAHFSARATVKLTTLELRHHFDVVEAHNMPDGLVLTAILPKLRGTGIILNLHDTFPELMVSKFGLPPDSWQIRALEREERVSAAVADLVLTATVQARARLAVRGVGVGRTHVVMNAPDERAFGPPRAPVTPPATGEVRVLYHGGTAPRFGVETLVTAVAQLVDGNDRVRLRICGTGEELPQLRALAARVAPARAEVAGPVPFAEIPAELRAAHIGVVPTSHDCFTELLLPVKLLEYIHAGLPVIASGLPGIRAYFSADEVRMVRPGDPAALAAAIAEVCANRSRLPSGPPGPRRGSPRRRGRGSGRRTLSWSTTSPLVRRRPGARRSAAIAAVTPRLSMRQAAPLPARPPRRRERPPHSGRAGGGLHPRVVVTEQAG